MGDCVENKMNAVIAGAVGGGFGAGASAVEPERVAVEGFVVAEAAAGRFVGRRHGDLSPGWNGWVGILSWEWRDGWWVSELPKIGMEREAPEVAVVAGRQSSARSTRQGQLQGEGAEGQRFRTEAWLEPLEAMGPLAEQGQLVAQARVYK